MTLRLLVFFVFLSGLCGCASMSTPLPVYSGPQKSIILREDYNWEAGFARIDYKFTAGEYLATHRDQDGLYYFQKDIPFGIFVSSNRQIVHGVYIKRKPTTPDERRAAESAFGPGTMLVATAMGMGEVAVGQIEMMVAVNGDWKNAFEFKD